LHELEQLFVPDHQGRPTVSRIGARLLVRLYEADAFDLLPEEKQRPVALEAYATTGAARIAKRAQREESTALSSAADSEAEKGAEDIPATLQRRVVQALQLTEAGAAVAEVCRRMKISEAEFYECKRRYALLALDEVRKLERLKIENARLKRLVGSLVPAESGKRAGGSGDMAKKNGAGKRGT
jgi:putative transposase